MQIHELNTASSINNADVLALDDGTMTGKVAVSALGKKITEDAMPTFTSGDSSTASSWTAVTAVTSGLSLKNILNRITTMMKNVRFLYNLLGTTDISSIGGGTVTGAISKLNTDLTTKKVYTASRNSTYFNSGTVHVHVHDAFITIIGNDLVAAQNITTSIAATICTSNKIVTPTGGNFFFPIVNYTAHTAVRGRVLNGSIDIPFDSVNSGAHLSFCITYMIGSTTS